MPTDLPSTSGGFSSAAAVAQFDKLLQSGEGRLAPVTEAMLSRLTGGGRVLDIAAGTGAQTWLAADRVGPTGEVIGIDVSAAMIQAAEAKLAGRQNVSFRVMDAQRLAFPADSFDAAISRNGLMFAADVPRALGEIYRVLRPGGILSAIVFADAARNPITVLAFDIAHRLAGLPPPDWTAPGMLALGAPGLFKRLLVEAGFQSVTVTPLPFPWVFPTLAHAVADRRDGASPLLLQILDTLDDATRERFWQELEDAYRAFTGPDGFKGPGEELLAVATKAQPSADGIHGRAEDIRGAP